MPWMSLDVVLDHRCQVGTCNDRLHPADTMSHNKWMDVSLEVVVSDGSWNLVLVLLIFPKSRVALQTERYTTLVTNDITALRVLATRNDVFWTTARRDELGRARDEVWIDHAAHPLERLIHEAMFDLALRCSPVLPLAHVPVNESVVVEVGSPLSIAEFLTCLRGSLGVPRHLLEHMPSSR